MILMMQFLRGGVKWGLFLVLFTPLLVWPDLLFPHLTPKVLIFQILIEWVSACALGVILLEGLTARQKKILMHPFILGVSAFLAYSLVSSAFGTDLRRSLWGFMDRQDGLVLILHFFAWFLILVWTFTWPEDEDKDVGKKAVVGAKRERNPLAYANISYWIAVLAALTALAEWIYARFIGFIPRFLMTGIPDRISGVLGNPVVLGPFLLFYFFYGFYYLVSTYRKAGAVIGSPGGKRSQRTTVQRHGLASSRLLAIIVAQALFILVIVLGQTRGVILGLMVGIIFSSVWVFFAAGFPKLWKLGVAAASLFLVLCGGIAYQLRDSSLVRRTPLLDRLTHLSTTESQSTRMRLLVWRSSLQGFWDRPVFGWGHDNVFYALNKHYNPEHAMFNPKFDESKPTWYDKSHNAYLDILVEKGVAGFALFLVVGFLVARTLWRIPDRLLAVCLAAGFVQYAASNFVSFDSFGPWFGLFLFLGVAVASESSSLEKKNNPNPHKARVASTKPKIIAVIILFIMALAGWFFNLQIWSSSELCLRAQQTFQSDPFQAMDTYSSAFERFMPYDARQKLNFAFLLASDLNPQNGRGNVQFVQWALRLGREALAEHRLDVAIYMTLNDICNIAALSVGKGELPEAAAPYIDQALEFGLKARALSPKRQEVVFYLGRTYILRNEPHRAIDLNREMLADTPLFPVAHMHLGLSLLAANQGGEAKSEFLKASQLGYRYRQNEIDVIKSLFSGEELQQLSR